jgi:hypothetical protein
MLMSVAPDSLLDGAESVPDAPSRPGTASFSSHSNLRLSPAPFGLGSPRFPSPSAYSDSSEVPPSRLAMSNTQIQRLIATASHSLLQSSPAYNNAINRLLHLEQELSVARSELIMAQGELNAYKYVLYIRLFVRLTLLQDNTSGLILKGCAAR